MAYHSVCLFFGGDICNERTYSVQAFIKVGAIFISIEAFRCAVVIMHYISKITGLLIP